ncbi:hypothetical protein A3844_24995 [Paenibacillus helianthi]|uniref:Phage major capsid protein n=1 Tax=Paenibacillus helianthi TaxID=1349432 RepID=A0ABX3EGU3_9BACL|nr:hypothetical protein [Paenibacillus helianthi]OKP81845.1 hypothetical protein A3844_24995 [Paenibacillus helianthi]
MKFTKIEDFQREQDAVSSKRGAIQRERDSALEKVQALKAEYAATMARSFETGADVTSKLDSLSDQLAAAEKDFRRKDLAVTMSAGVKAKMPADEVMLAWNTEYLPKYRTEVFNPLVDALEKARDEYYKAYAACSASVQAVENERQSVVYTLDPNYGLNNRYIYKLQKPDYFSKTARYVIKPEDIQKLAVGDKPDNADLKGGA